MKIKTTDFKKALDIVKPGLSTNENIEQATSFVFKDGRVYTYNDEISISHPMNDFDVTGAVRAVALHNYISKLKRDEMEIKTTATEMQIKCGRSRAGLPLATEIELPLNEIQKAQKWHPLHNAFVDMMRMAAGACATDMNMGKLTCVFVSSDGTITGSDNYRILQATLSAFAFEDFLIPAQNVRHIANLKPTEISVVKNWIHFRNEQDTIISSRTFPEDYADVSEFTKLEGQEFEFPSTVREVLERARVFSKNEITSDEDVEFTIGENRIKIRAVGDNGWFEEQLNYKYSDAPFVFTIMPYLLLDILSRAHVCTVNENGLLFRGDGWVYVSALKSMQ